MEGFVERGGYDLLKTEYYLLFFAVYHSIRSTNNPLPIYLNFCDCFALVNPAKP